MIPVLSRAEMRAFDARAIADHVPGLLLMENAGRGAAEAILRELPGFQRPLIVCGTGNNGGDGFVIARHWITRGVRPVVLLLGAEDRVRGDAATQLAALRGVGGVVRRIDAETELPAVVDAAGASDLIVDALFGTGLDRALSPSLVAVVEALNRATAKRVAIDIPSGIDADTGREQGAAIHADVTVTFAHLKLGLLTPTGTRCTGRVVVVDIGVPPDRVCHGSVAAHAIEALDVAGWLGARAIDTHKHRAGHVAIVAGSPGKIGAALLAADGALRAGAGLVTIATWASAASVIEMRVVEVMTARLYEGDVEASVDAAIEGKRVVAVGPGFGTGEPSRAAIARVLERCSGHVVLDADALTVLAKAPELFAHTRGAVLTPHGGEAARLLGISPSEVEADRFAAVRAMAEKTQAIVILKGACSLVRAPDGRIAINTTGSPALATAGSGDVLTGMIAALRTTLPPFEAACAGVFLHGHAGEAWAREHGDRGLFAREIAERVPSAMRALVAGHTP